MSTALHDLHATPSFSRELEAETGIRVSLCYQCGKCSAGCPMLPDMDWAPNQIMRLIQLDRRDEALRSRTIWYCASCLTCTTRCPQEVKIAEVMDALRELSRREGKAHRDSHKVRSFARSFLKTIERKGRLHEMGMIVDYKLSSRDYFADLMLAPQMFMKGKIKPFAHGIKDVAGVRRLFVRTPSRG